MKAFAIVCALVSFLLYTHASKRKWESVGDEDPDKELQRKLERLDIQERRPIYPDGLEPIIPVTSRAEQRSPMGQSCLPFKKTRKRRQRRGTQPGGMFTFAEELHTFTPEASRKITAEEEAELTKWLAPHQLNEFQEKYGWEVDNFGHNILSYFMTCGSPEQLLGLMRTALKKDWEYLFTCFSAPACVPQTPGAIELLEQGLEKYPTLRKNLLLAMYGLGHPVKNWHFSPSEHGDLEVFTNLVVRGRIMKEDVIAFLSDVMELDREGNLEELLTEHGYLGADNH